MKNLKYTLPLIIFLFTFSVFKNWFLLDAISSGDFSIGTISLKNISLIPYAWDNSGMGGNYSFLLFGHSLYLSLFFLGKFTGVLLATKIIYFYSFLFLSVTCTVLLFKKIFEIPKLWLASVIIYLFNTYILMVVGGGQMGVALSYSIAPLVLYLFIKLVGVNEISNFKFQISNFKYPIIAGLFFGLQMMLDIRIAYVTMVAIVIYFLINLIFNHARIFQKIIYVFFIPLTISLLIHAFWLLPVLIIRQNPIEQMGTVYSSIDAVRFFSFAKFEDTLSLLHPNWPENIFGKVYFMRPEFLFLPILAFSSLLFIARLKVKNSSFAKASEDKQKSIIYFALLGLIGAFLAKGANPPFGDVYLWMFNHITGFQMFRDPTKWYLLIALSYSMLIPFTLSEIYILLSSKFKVQSSKLQFKIQNYIPEFFLILSVLYLIVLIRPAIFGQLNGTFKPHQIPNEYVKFNQFISSQHSFYRTFWVPVPQRYAFNSSSHPVVSGQNFYSVVSVSAVLSKLKSNSTEKILQEAAVKYIVVPFDRDGEIFLEDRKYDEKVYLKTIAEIKKIGWLREVDCSVAKSLNCSDSPFGRIKVFELTGQKDHFFISNQQSPVRNASQSDAGGAISSQKLKYEYINQTKYEVNIENAKAGKLLVFSESFDKNWVAKIKDQETKIISQKYNDRFNSFKLQKNGNYSLVIYYQPQKWVNIGLIISLATFLSTLFFLGFGYMGKKW